MAVGTTIIAILIAVILVAAKLILEHQRDLDRRDGCEQSAESYTMKGMLKIMWEEHKIKKDEKKEARRAARQARYTGAQASTKISVQSFKKKDKAD